MAVLIKLILSVNKIRLSIFLYIYHLQHHIFKKCIVLLNV